MNAIGQPVLLTSFEDVRLALNNPSLSRSLDPEQYEKGNILEGVVMMLDGDSHRDRRRVENTLFRRDNLVLYEREIFPQVIDDTLSHVVPRGEADLVSLGALLAVVLSARTAGVDFDLASLDARSDLVRFVRTFAKGISIDAAVADLETIRRDVAKGLDEFTVRFLNASRERRLKVIATEAEPEAASPDLLTLLLLKADDLNLNDQQVVRETAFFLEAGAHTSSQSLASSMHYVFSWLGKGGDQDALGDDLALLQRFVHEALRLRPTNPRIRRRVTAPTSVGLHAFDTGDLVDLDTATANRDRAIYGSDADGFNPSRTVPSSVARYGHSFGGGIHACIGRNLAIGFPIRFDSAPPDDHLFGIVPLMVQAILRRGVRPHPTREPAPDTTTHRWTRWASYPVQFGQTG